MFGKKLFKILSVLAVLGQVAFAKPTPDTPAKPTTPKKALCNYYPGREFLSHDKALSPSAKLFMSFISGLMSAAVNYSEKAKPIADGILKDSELLAHIDNDEVKTLKEKLETFVNAYNDCKDGKALFKLVEIFSESTSEFYEQEKDQKLSPEGKIILKLLKQNKVEQIEEELAAEVKNINEKVNKWFFTLNENDQVDVFEVFINLFALI